MQSVITLASQRFTAGVSPALAGSLLWFGLAEQIAIDFVRPATVRACCEGSARLSSCYPLVPYSNRIGDGRFEFQGVRYVLRRNADISEHPIHGLGWLHPWTVVSSTPDQLQLTISHDGEGGRNADWPWSYSATQTFTLDDDGLRHSIGMTNRDRRAMPAGIGLHPFFPKSPATQVCFEAEAVWRNSERMLPQERTVVPPEWNFSQRGTVAGLTVDNCFAGWTRNADIVWPERGWGLRLEASAVFGHLVVFTSEARDSIAIEPVSHVNNALNLADVRDDTGLRILAPGETLEGTLAMTPFAL